MKNDQKVETRRDRKALARDAGMGRLSILSVLAGALSAFAAFEALVALAGAVIVAIHGGTNFGTVGLAGFQTLLGIMLALGLFVAFMLGGYVAGRMSRRSGASHGLLAGVLGVVLGLGIVVAVRASGADKGLARVAAHIQVATTWHDWRTFGLAGAVVVAAAMILGGLTGGIEGERWHGKLLARAVDPSFGPEAEERASARKRLRQAEMARLAAADHVSRLTATSKAANAGSVESRADRAAAEPTSPTTAVMSRATRRGPAVANPGVPVTADRAVADRPVADRAAGDESAAAGRRPHRHLLGRR